MKSFKELKEEALRVINIYRVLIAALIVAAVLFVVDYNNWISQLFFSVPETVWCVLLPSAVIVFILTCMRYSVLQLLVMKIITKSDEHIISATCSVGVYFVFYITLLRDGDYKWIACTILFSIGIVLLLIRFIIVYKAIAISNSTSIKLQDVIENRITKEQLPIIVSEKVDTTDLLGRESVVNNLYRAVTANHKDRCYTIGLEGNWGSGKTTIIEIVKEKFTDNKIIIIDDFDPWLYKSQEALLITAYERMVEKLGIKYNPQKIQRAIQSVHKGISEKHSIFGVFTSFFFESEQDSVIQELRTQIETVLKRDGKTVLFVLDNLDRASKATVLSIFKFISLMLNCPGIIYLLSYDKNKIDRIFEKQGEYEERFYEKIIDQEIKLPEISDSRRSTIVERSMCNLITLYEENVDIQRYKEIIRFLAKSRIDIRQFKRYINTVFPIVFIEATTLSKKDLLTITTIQFFAFDLYSEVSRKREYFISSDISQYDPYRAFSINEEEFANKSKEYFKDLENSYPEYISLLRSIFPAMGIFGVQQRLGFNSEEYQKISQECKICSGKYFDLYFSYGSNQYTLVKGVIDNYLILLRNSADFCADTRKMAIALSDELHKEFVEQLQLHISTVPLEYYGKLLCALYDNVDRFDDSYEAFSISAYRRIPHIIAILLKKCMQSDFDQFLEMAITRIDRLQSLRRIYHNFKDRNELEQANRLKAVENVYRSLCQNILSQEIDIYDDGYYRKGNIWSILVSGLPESIGDLDLYMHMLRVPKNVYRILWDCTQESISTQGLGYMIDEQNLKTLFDKTEIADELIKANEPQSDDEIRLLGLYNKFKYLGEADPDENIEYQNERWSPSFPLRPIKKAALMDANT